MVLFEQFLGISRWLFLPQSRSLVAFSCLLCPLEERPIGRSDSSKARKAILVLKRTKFYFLALGPVHEKSRFPVELLSLHNAVCPFMVLNANEALIRPPKHTHQISDRGVLISVN